MKTKVMYGRPLDATARARLAARLLDDEHATIDLIGLAVATIARAAVGLPVHEGNAQLIESRIGR